MSLSGEMTQLPFGEEGSAPAVAAKGDRIAYVRGREARDIRRADLTAERPEETATKLIYSTRTQALPRYSSDGLRIVLSGLRGFPRGSMDCGSYFNPTAPAARKSGSPGPMAPIRSGLLHLTDLTPMRRAGVPTGAGLRLIPEPQGCLPSTLKTLTRESRARWSLRRIT